MDMKERAELIAKQEEAMRVSQRANSHIFAGESHFYVVTCHMWLSQRANSHISEGESDCNASGNMWSHATYG